MTDGKDDLISESRIVHDSLDKSLDILDPGSKRALLYYLEERFNISMNDNKARYSVNDIHQALSEIRGAGADIIIERLKNQIRTTRNQ